MKAFRVPLFFLVIVLLTDPMTAIPQETAEVAIIKFSWQRERISHRPSIASLQTSEVLAQQGRRELELSQARNAQDAGRVARVETSMNRQKEATSKASQTEPPRDGYRYRVTLRNDSEKTIKSIDWDYIFIDPENQNEVARHQFTSDETIKPGKTKEVSVLYLIQPVKTISVRMLSKRDPLPYREQVVISRVLFADGSVWQP